MHRRRLGLLAAAVLLVTACGPAATTSPEATGGPTGGPTDGASPPPTAPPADGQTLTMAMDGDVSGGLSNAADNVPTAEAMYMLYNGLYVYDDALTPIPELADGEADISADGTVWTIRLKDGVTFHDGTDLTAEDVIQTYELAMSTNCRYNPDLCTIRASLVSVEQGDDEMTVVFTLNKTLATFASVFLPSIKIDSKDAVDASYDRYLEKVNQISAADTGPFLDRVDAETDNPTGPPDEEGNATANYSQFVDEGEDLLERAGQELPDRTLYTTDGVLDENTYGLELITRVRAVDAAFTADRSDALAAAYPYLDYQVNPVGTGRFKFVQYRVGESLEYEAFADYFEGPPQISRVFIPIIKDDIAGGQALVAGQIDWKYSLEGTTYDEIKDDPNLKFIEYPDFGFFAVYFNLREGRLFAEKELRQAVAYCFDKPQTVEVATTASGVAIYSEIPPASWAFPAEGLETYDFNPETGRQLLEQAGWTLGSDGVREKDGRKLSTVAAVRAGRPDRSAFMQLMGDQARENCGIDIDYREVEFGALLTMLDNFPHINAAAPETNQPFDVYFGGFGTSYDPDPYSLYHTDSCSTATSGPTFNYACIAYPELDTLIEDGLSELDQDARAEIYQEYAILQSQELPVLYAWADIAREGIRSTIDTTAEGGLPTDSPEWFWQWHLLTNIR